MNHILNIKVLDESLYVTYKNNASVTEQKFLAENPDSGFDVYAKERIEIEPFKVSFIKTGISATSTLDGVCQPYWLLPRSSISKTPLMMANSVGVIDAGYRGELMCPVRNMSNEVYVVESGTRLFQIVSRDMRAYCCVNIVNELGESVRGEGGFGSTGEK